MLSSESQFPYSKGNSLFCQDIAKKKKKILGKSVIQTLKSNSK